MTIARPVSMQELPAAQADVRTAGERLLSLDVFRGLVIVAMLIVNNIGDWGVTGYWWKHINWVPTTQAEAYRQWWAAVGQAGSAGAILAEMGQFPLFVHVTLADFVMPWFILAIGVAIPFSVAASERRGVTRGQMWLRIVRRSMVLVVLGWAIDASLRVLYWHHSSDANAVLSFTLGMNVLQLLGVSYLAARIICLLPMSPRLALAMGLFIGYWALLRLYPQPVTETGGGTGAFTAAHNAAKHMYDTWAVFGYQPITSWLNVSVRGMLSVIPVTAAMVLGTWIGHTIARDGLSIEQKVRKLAAWGAVMAIGGFVWAFDLTFNKPVWTPSYLLYTSGVGSIIIGGLYWMIDGRRSRWWTRFFVVFGMNSIAAYWLPIMAKIWLLNMPRVRGEMGEPMMLTRAVIEGLQDVLGKWGGSWAFTLLFLGFWWVVFEMAYRRRWFWKV
jgi:predicted acyltransferase